MLPSLSLAFRNSKEGGRRLSHSKSELEANNPSSLLVKVITAWYRFANIPQGHADFNSDEANLQVNYRGKVAMSAPLIGMSFPSFMVLLIISAIAAAVVHWGFRYQLFRDIDGFMGEWMVAWLGAWLGPAVLGHWFDNAMVAQIYVIPALIGAFAGAFGGALNAKILTGVIAQRGRD